MARKSPKALPVPRSKPLQNARHESLAQYLATGKYTQPEAWALATQTHLETPEELRVFCLALTPNQKDVLRRSCQRGDVRGRQETIQLETHLRFQKSRLKEFEVSNGWVMESLWNLYLMAIQAVPVTDGRGENVGIWKFDGNTATKALNLIGDQNGMFVKKHHHMHDISNPLEGGREQILGNIKRLLGSLTDADFQYVTGVERPETVDASFRRSNGSADEPRATLQPLS